MHYLDNAATTVVNEQVISAIEDAMRRYFGNPSALYGPGAQSERAIKNARTVMARALGCTAGEVIFTACGSESNNIALWGAALSRRSWAENVVSTGYEHPSVEKPLQRLREFGYETRFVNPSRDGRVSVEELVRQVDGKTALVTAMQVNNETGAVLDVVKLARAVKAKNPRTAVHVDGVQGFCKLPLHLEGSGVDSYAASGHKLHAPKGVGLLYLRKGYRIEPPYLGGGQEGGLRPGTENVPYIVGFAKAVELIYPHLQRRLIRAKEMNAYLRDRLAALPGVRINSPSDALPFTLNLTAPGVRSETMLHFLEQREVYVSSGSACSKGAPSKTLAAMGLPEDEIDSSLRVSMSGETTREDLDALTEGLAEGLAGLQKKGRR
ncbi:MAG: cysteine desulfurase family protein [Oscillospiraceae bacterium]|nr:cysteine desulfurase family protein [Oscillospiraceae bacterium]